MMVFVGNILILIFEVFLVDWYLIILVKLLFFEIDVNIFLVE